MNITIGRYAVPNEQERQEIQAGTDKEVNFPADTWESWIEPEDGKWILFVGKDGSAAFWPQRDERGGVIGDATTSDVVNVVIATNDTVPPFPELGLVACVRMD